MAVQSGGDDGGVDARSAISFSGYTHRGAVRRINEDSYVAASPIFAVADGMGGHAHGDRASQAAIATLSTALLADGEIRPDDVLEAIRRANSEVLALGAHERVISGTTLSGIALVSIGAGGERWMAFNVGDSRVYRWDGRVLEQLTVDHSAVQELVDEGLITRAAADVHPARNIVTRALGAHAVVDPDVWLFPIEDRGMFLICSDGLTKELPDDEIARIMVFDAASGTPGSLPERLANAAVAAGGSDNVTVIVVESHPSGTQSIAVGEDTLDRGAMPLSLEETRPRG